jgi:hypothetical protein
MRYESYATELKKPVNRIVMMNKDIQYYVATALGYSDYDAFLRCYGIKVSLDIYKGGIQNERDMLCIL